MTKIVVQARWIRWARWLHRKTALALFIFLLLVTVTGILLGLKKQLGLIAPTEKGRSASLASWLPVSVLEEKASRFLRDSVSPGLSVELDRMDIRPGKGIVKFLYKDHYWSLQLDGTTGDLLSIEKRHSDFIENLHDGTILDNIFGTGNEGFQAGYSTLMGSALLLLLLSGLWLWYGPRRIRKKKREHLL